MRSPRRRRSGGDDAAHDDRWLLTYSDMITLLLALFIVMWSISSVNISKFDQLKASLRSAFSGKVLPADNSILQGQQSPMEQDGTPVQTPVSYEPQPAAQAPTIQENIAAALQAAARKQDNDNLEKIQQEIRSYAHEHGLSSSVKTSIVERGLVVRVLTDQVLFASGEATLQASAGGLLSEMAHLIASPDIPNPVRVEGNTDSVPIHSSLYRSNWELSTARATAVLQFLLAHGVSAHRLSVTGYGAEHPIASNTTAAGRAANRRVELVILRRSFSTTDTEGS